MLSILFLVRRCCGCLLGCVCFILGVLLPDKKLREYHNCIISLDLRNMVVSLLHCRLNKGNVSHIQSMGTIDNEPIQFRHSSRSVDMAMFIISVSHYLAFVNIHYFLLKYLNKD
jgi:hypothetical protein